MDRATDDRLPLPYPCPPGYDGGMATGPRDKSRFPPSDLILLISVVVLAIVEVVHPIHWAALAAIAVVAFWMLSSMLLSILRFSRRDNPGDAKQPPDPR